MADEILKRHEDYMDWDKLIQHCETIKGFTELEREEAKRAFRLLQKEFGNDFLKDVFANNHPIRGYIINLAPWTRRWMTWFAKAVKELKDQENYPSLLSRLKDSGKFGEGLSVLEIAYKFSKAGFRISIDPQVNVSTQTKIPDLKARNDTGEELFVEVSVQKQSFTEKEAWETMNTIVNFLWNPSIHYCGRIHKILTEKHLDEIAKKVGKIIEKSMKENIFHDLVIEGTIEIGIAPEEDKEILQKWADERGLKLGEFSGPPYDVDETSRIKNKIKEEQRQLPKNNPNIVVVMNNNLFFQAKDIIKVISELEEEVYRYPHLLAAVVSGGYWGGGENIIITKDQHIFIRKTNVELLVEQYIIIFNQFCNIKITPAVITKMYNAFRNY